MTAARKIRAAVVGASGYAGSELTRFLLAHPAVELTHLYVSAAATPAGRLQKLTAVFLAAHSSCWNP